jgi:transforming growth factor-beta-induced protein
MKKITNYSIVFIFFVVLFTSCKKDEVIATNPSFEEFVKTNTNLSMFGLAVEKANLVDFIKGPGPFTWFAPTNAAFTQAGITMDSLNRMTTARISYFLTYHLVNTRYTGANMLALSSITRSTQNGNLVYNGSFNNFFYVNGARISSADNQIANGIIHVTDRFLIPPVLNGNIISILNASGQHSLFIEAITRAGLLTTLSSTSTFTVMAPTNTAMIAAGYTSAGIAATPVATLLNQFRYHYFNAVRLFTNDLAADATTVATAAGPSTFLRTSEAGTRVRGANNPSAILISRSDVLGTNGIVHVIDGVLRP